jgi:hypothetical protein
MNRTILSAICFLAGIYLHGQVNSNGFVLRFGGNYNETTASNALRSVIGYNAKTKDGSMSLSAGYLYKRWLFDLGFEYTHNKTEASGQFAALSESSASMFVEQGTISLNSHGGLLSTNYFIPVLHNLYFTPGFYLGFGAINGNNSGITASQTLPVVSGDWTLQKASPAYLQEYDVKISSNYFYMRLSPELTWFFTDHFGLNVQMGGLGINNVDSGWNKQISFNPALWTFGIIFKI